MSSPGAPTGTSPRPGRAPAAATAAAAAGCSSGTPARPAPRCASSPPPPIAADPELGCLDTAALAWWRSTSDVDDAAATLAWLAEHPDHADGLRYLSTDTLPGWPERLPARTRARAETLVGAGWAAQTASDAADTLAATAARGGPDAVAAWLDELADTGNAAVIDLPTRP